MRLGVQLPNKEETLMRANTATLATGDLVVLGKAPRCACGALTGPVSYRNDDGTWYSKGEYLCLDKPDEHKQLVVH